MPDNKQTVIDFWKLVNSVSLLNQRVARNYLRNSSGYHHDIRDIYLTYFNIITKMLVSPAEAFKIFNLSVDFMQLQLNAWKNIFLEATNIKVIEPQKGDKRFLDPEWNTNPYFDFLKENYLLAAKLCRQIVDEIETDDKHRRKLDFYTGQYIDALSPSNFLFTNPSALKLAIETNGQSLVKGLNNLIADLEKGKITQTDESAFVVGENLAITPGSVVYENEIFQLIQYLPQTKNCYEIPLLIVPPWINKYYVLDLQPKNSFVKFLLEKGIRVFMISWRNPQPGMGYLSLDDYVAKGALKAIEVISEISGSKKINTLGYCLGGTLLSITCSILAQKKENNPVNSATFLAAMVDFTDIGPMGDVIDGALIQKLERGELLKDGLLRGPDMETAFNLIRDNDLVWNYVVNNYLKGKKPEAFDVMYWTNDNTNLPGGMYIYYMREMILENKLSRKNALKICNTQIDIGKIEVPVFVISFCDDIISPATTGFTTTELVKGPVEFILGESGHVMGVVNPPTKKKYGHYIKGKLTEGFESWSSTAKRIDGSWWTTWVEKIINFSGKEIPAPLTAGNKKYAIIEPAPGKYVKEKCK